MEMEMEMEMENKRKEKKEIRGTSSSYNRERKTIGRGSRGLLSMPWVRRNKLLTTSAL
jgi:hypothetical protein